MTDVTLIGLGQMGFALADLMVKAGKSVSLWNRSPEKAAGLVLRGAVLAETPAAAIVASPVTLVGAIDNWRATGRRPPPAATGRHCR